MAAERFQVGPETLVSLRYAVFDAEGEAVDAPLEPVEVVFGMGLLLPGLEQAIDGLYAGDKKSVRLAPEQAYGRRDPTALIEVDRDDFPADVAPGDRFEAETEQGELVILRVLEVLEDAVVVDTNHPLADQTVRFDLEIVGVRPATEAEIAAVIARLEAAESPDQSLVPPGRLLRGGGQRYESGHTSAGPAQPADGEPVTGPRRGNGSKLA
jgi:FKBP-type peptidyl-prolyl cis-trans isomerase SlyD